MVPPFFSRLRVIWHALRLPDRLERLRAKLRFQMLLERFGPPVLALAMLAGLFVAAAFSGVLGVLGIWGHWLVLGLFIAAGGGILWRWRHARWPSPAQVDTRLDALNAGLHAPLATLADQPTVHDPLAQALWQRHLAQAEQRLAALKVPTLTTGFAARDPYSLRILIAVAVIASAYAAGHDKTARLHAALTPGALLAATTPPRLDLWLEPPAYTGRPVVFFSVPPAQQIDMPVGTRVVVQLSQQMGETYRLALRHGAGLVEAPEAQPEAPASASQKPASPAQASSTAHATVSAMRAIRVLAGDADLDISASGRVQARYRFHALPDSPPEAQWLGLTLERHYEHGRARQALQLHYRLADDYDLAQTDLVVERAVAAKAPTLFDPPETLLPQERREHKTAVDLFDHPWAGAEVNMRIRARDAAGQTAFSLPRRFTLPAPVFVHPLAALLAEHRRLLTFSPEEGRGQILKTLTDLLQEPLPGTEIAEFLALQTLRFQFLRARDTASLRNASDEMYALALAFEFGQVYEAQQRLSAAERALKEALAAQGKENPGQNEAALQTLAALKQALSDMLSALAHQNDKGLPVASDAPTLSLQALEDKLKALEAALRSGDLAAQQQALQAMQAMLETLKNAQIRPVDAQTRAMLQQREAIEQLEQAQRDLRDRSFQTGKEGFDPERQKNLRDEQYALQQRLQTLTPPAGQNRSGPSPGSPQNPGSDALLDALEGMNQAAQALGENDPDSTEEGQRRSLEGLRRASEALSQALEARMGGGPGLGMDPDGQGFSREGESEGLGNGESRDAAGGAGAARARRILQEIRRRSGETTRPVPERDYLQRLLRE